MNYMWSSKTTTVYRQLIRKYKAFFILDSFVYKNKPPETTR